MQTKNISLALPQNEWVALCEDAGQQLRNPKQHARYLLRQALGIAEPTVQETQNATSGHIRQDLATSSVL